MLKYAILKKNRKGNSMDLFAEVGSLQACNANFSARKKICNRLLLKPDNIICLKYHGVLSRKHTDSLHNSLSTLEVIYATYTFRFTIFDIFKIF